MANSKAPEIDLKPSPQPQSFSEQLPRLPAAPGVYLFRDRGGKVIYVGKAKNLRARVRSYARGGDERSQVPFLLRHIASVESLVTANEKEALVLENNLIKQYKPRYNIRLKDDKTYVSVKVTIGQKWPRVFATRKVVQDGAAYFGPFTSAYALHQTLDTIRKVFPLRTCSDTVFRNRSRPCLEYQIKRCLAPCCLPVDAEEYRRYLREACLLLEGKDQALRQALERRMQEAAQALRFEEAARLRDQIAALDRTVEQHRAVSRERTDRDVFGLYREGGFIEISVLFVRAGKITGSQAYGLEDFEFSDEEVLEAVLTQFYQGERHVPDEILLPAEISDADVREEYLGEKKGKRVAIVTPRRGSRLELVRMARENARQAFGSRTDARSQREKMLEQLGRSLRLRNAPKRIECFDISNIQGALAVGSMVVFDEGEPQRSRYRRFKVKSSGGADDFGMMYEVLTRRFRRAKEEGELPDLVVVDGGKGQLNVALAVFEELGITGVDAVALAKMRAERAPRSEEVRRSPERVFLPGRKKPVILRRNSTALFLLQRIRDEAHRFAISYHKKLRKKARMRSALEDVAGVGAGRRRALLRHFGSVARIRQATCEEISRVPGVSERLARQIKAHLESVASGEPSACGAEDCKSQ